MTTAKNDHKNRRVSGLISAVSIIGLLSLLCGSARAAEISVIIKDSKQRSVHDTVVELVGTEAGSATAGPMEISQQGEEFEPLLSLIPRGSSVTFTNRDPFKHHVYSVSAGNEFDLPLFRDEPTSPVQFNTPGVVKMGCNIHDWMLAFGYVSEGADVVIADSGGQARFSDLAGGEYRLKIWNPRLKNNRKIIVQNLSLAPGESRVHEVEVSLRKTIRRPARTPQGSDASKDRYGGNN